MQGTFTLAVTESVILPYSIFALTTNLSQNLTPSKGMSYPVGDLYRHFTKLTLPSDYTLHSNPIPLTDGTNGLL